MKSYKALVEEVLNQRAIIDNRQVVDLADINKSVLIAFNQACEFMRDLHAWRWNSREETYVNNLGQDTYPMPYGIVRGVVYTKVTSGEKCALVYTDELTAEKGCPVEWTNKWDTEEIAIAPAVSNDCNNVSTTTIQYQDKHIAVLGNRVGGTLLERFSLTEDTDNQFLNVPAYVYDAYARCVVLKTRVFLNENAQTTVFPAQQQEWQEALSGLMKYAKTPYYISERTEI